MNAVNTYTLLAIIFAVLCIFAPWLDGQPSDVDADRDTQATLQDALLAAAQQQRFARATAAMEIRP